MTPDEIRKRLYNVPVGSPEFFKLKEALDRAEARVRKTKKYKIQNIHDFYKAAHKEEADAWLENDLQIYMLGFDIDADDPKNFEALKRTVRLTRMSHDDLDGFRKMVKMRAAGIVIQECVVKGVYKREQWNNGISICKALSPELPEDPETCAVVVLKELIRAWPNNTN